jgi:hypothetical protein
MTSHSSDESPPDERPLLLCWSCGWLHVGVPAPEPAGKSCYRCKATEFRVISHDEAMRKIPRGVTLQTVRWPPDSE